jgi:hypothetical protein
MDWLKTLATVAPTVATAFGGPLAGMAVSVATKALGIENDEVALEQAVMSGNPDILLKLKQVDLDFKLELKRLDIKSEELVIDDRKDARGLAKTDMRPHITISIVFITGYFTLAYYQATGQIALDPMVFGVITASMPMILQFWFGSSHGSKQKSDAMGAGK